MQTLLKVLGSKLEIEISSKELFVTDELIGKFSYWNLIEIYYNTYFRQALTQY